jgi:hypothetical protein
MSVQLRLPQGAPLLTTAETVLVNGRSTYTLPRSWRRECRVFVEQAAGQVGCRILSPSEVVHVRERRLVSGLRNATLRFYHETGTERSVEMMLNPTWPFIDGPRVDWHHRTDVLGDYLEARGVTGDVMISW